MSRHERVLLDGPAGNIEVFVESAEHPSGIAIVAHPHPLFGGSADNKVVTTLAKTFRELGCAALRPNFRGVGASEGAHGHGVAETDDLLAVHAWARGRFGALPVHLAGFSFGARVVVQLAQRLAELGDPAARLVLVGAAVAEAAAVPADTLVIHGSADETVPLADVLAWAEPLELPVTVIPGADHFFHRRLHVIRRIVEAAWCR